MSSFLVETHCHTNTVSPCGKLAADELVRLYAAAGYSVLITTDHLVEQLPIFRDARSWEEKVDRYYSGYRAAREAGKRHDLVVLPGFELTFSSLSGRDFLVYGIDEQLLANLPEVATMQPEAALERVRSLGGLVFQAHPYRYSEPVQPTWLDGVEVMNGNPRHNSQNKRAAAFALEHDLLALSGSDTHQGEDVARGGIQVPDLPQTIHEFVSLLRERYHEIELLDPEEAAQLS